MRVRKTPAQPTFPLLLKLTESLSAEPMQIVQTVFGIFHHFELDRRSRSARFRSRCSCTCTKQNAISNNPNTASTKTRLIRSKRVLNAIRFVPGSSPKSSEKKRCYINYSACPTLRDHLPNRRDHQPRIIQLNEGSATLGDVAMGAAGKTQRALLDLFLRRTYAVSRDDGKVVPYSGVHMKLLAAAILTLAVPATAQQAITWRFGNLSKIGGVPVATIGHPQVVDTSIGKAIHFEGHGDPDPANPQSGNPTGDALLLNTAPLSGFPTYTFEVIFRPSSKGAPAQRFFHMQDANSPSRRMFEIRIVNHQWCLDTVAIDIATVGIDSARQQQGSPEHHGFTIVRDPPHLHPLDRWYAVAATYDGKILRGYVDGQLQGQISVNLSPLPPGTTSIGTRIDRRDFFTGDLYSARFTPRVLPPADFLKVPSGTR